MNKAIDILEYHLVKLHDSYNKYVMNGDVDVNGNVAKNTREHIQQIQEALSILKNPNGFEKTKAGGQKNI